MYCGLLVNQMCMFFVVVVWLCKIKVVNVSLRQLFQWFNGKYSSFKMLYLILSYRESSSKPATWSAPSTAKPIYYGSWSTSCLPSKSINQLYLYSDLITVKLVSFLFHSQNIWCTHNRHNMIKKWLGAQCFKRSEIKPHPSLKTR